MYRVHVEQYLKKLFLFAEEANDDKEMQIMHHFNTKRARRGRRAWLNLLCCCLTSHYSLLYWLGYACSICCSFLCKTCGLSLFHSTPFGVECIPMDEFNKQSLSQALTALQNATLCLALMTIIYWISTLFMGLSVLVAVHWLLVFTIITTIGSVIYPTMRVTLLLSVPTLCSRRFQWVLFTFILLMAASYPLMNTLRNFSANRDAVICVHRQVRHNLQNLMTFQKKPYQLFVDLSHLVMLRIKHHYNKLHKKIKAIVTAIGVVFAKMKRLLTFLPNWSFDCERKTNFETRCMYIARKVIRLCYTIDICRSFGLHYHIKKLFLLRVCPYLRTISNMCSTIKRQLKDYKSKIYRLIGETFQNIKETTRYNND